MNDTHVENEVKFLLCDLPRFESRLIQAGAILKHPRIFEINLRFDLPNHQLTIAHRVLRLRRDDRSRLTYKGPADLSQSISSRQELEIEVSDFDTARLLLESLGYIVTVQYEKWRTTYQLQDVEVVLDELPFGKFCELEAAKASQIKKLAQLLGLHWDSRCLLSYLVLFDQLRLQKKLKVSQLTFREFEKLKISSTDLGLTLGDVA
jgi:adenylate cyclase, class 2